MKILLIKPPHFHRTEIFESEKFCQPLGLAYLAAQLKITNKKLGVQIIDAAALDYSISQILAEVKKMAPEIVGLTSVTPNFSETVKIARQIKGPNNPPLVILGGPHVTAQPTALKDSCFDFGVLGEGEETLAELILSLEKKEANFGKIKGLAFRQKQKLIINPSRPYLTNLDKLPFPARELLPPLSFYKPSPSMYRRLPMATIITSRGCPFRCFFCSRSVFGNFYRTRSPKNVVDEMEILIKNFGAQEIKIQDDTFNVDEERVLEICRLILKRRLKFTWTCLARADLVTYRMLKYLRRAGCWQIAYGIESGNQKVLNTIRKGLSLEKIKRAVKLTHEAGIESRGFFMLGLPGETKETLQQTINLANQLPLDVANFFLTIPFPGTELAQKATKFGRVRKGKHQDYLYQVATIPPFIPYGLTANQIEKSLHKAYRNFYLRPKFLLRQLAKIRSLSQAIIYLQALFSIIKMGIKL